METLNKTFLAAFGNSYDLEIVNRKKAEELIANSWNEALTNSISQFGIQLQDYANTFSFNYSKKK